MSNPLVQSTGRRKEAVARVRLRPGSGIITVRLEPSPSGVSADGSVAQSGLMAWPASGASTQRLQLTDAAKGHPHPWTATVEFQRSAAAPLRAHGVTLGAGVGSWIW